MIAQAKVRTALLTSLLPSLLLTGVTGSPLAYAGPDVIHAPEDAPIDSTKRKQVEEQIAQTFRNDPLLSDSARKAEVTFYDNGQTPSMAPSEVRKSTQSSRRTRFG